LMHVEEIWMAIVTILVHVKEIDGCNHDLDARGGDWWLDRHDRGARGGDWWLSSRSIILMHVEKRQYVAMHFLQFKIIWFDRKLIWLIGVKTFSIINTIATMRLIDYLRFYVPLKNFSLTWGRHHCRWRAEKFMPMLGDQGLWAGRDLYRATSAVTRDLSFSSLIRSTANLVAS
jgi:hypothetical protein